MFNNVEFFVLFLGSKTRKRHNNPHVHLRGNTNDREECLIFLFFFNSLCRKITKYLAGITSHFSSFYTGTRGIELEVV